MPYTCIWKLFKFVILTILTALVDVFCSDGVKLRSIKMLVNWFHVLYGAIEILLIKSACYTLETIFTRKICLFIQIII